MRNTLFCLLALSLSALSIPALAAPTTCPALIVLQTNMVHPSQYCSAGAYASMLSQIKYPSQPCSSNVDNAHYTNDLHTLATECGGLVYAAAIGKSVGGLGQNAAQAAAPQVAAEAQPAVTAGATPAPAAPSTTSDHKDKAPQTTSDIFNAKKKKSNGTTNNPWF